MEKPENRLSAGGWLIIAVLVALLIASSAYAIHIWTSVSTAMSGWGWGMLVMGVIVSIVLGVGLMFLMFYSARHDMDQ